MDFGLNEEQRSLVALAKDFCQREVDPKDIQRRLETPIKSTTTQAELREMIPWNILSKAQDVGLRQLTVPEKYGGSGFGARNWLTLCKVAEEMGYWGGAIVFMFTTMWKQVFAYSFASQEVQERFFPEFMKNIKTWQAVAFTEADYGGDIQATMYKDPDGKVGKVTAKLEGNNWILNGDKEFSSGGGQANWLGTSARVGKGPYQKAANLFIIPPNTPGVTMERVHPMIGDPLVPAVAFHFENVKLPKAYVFGKPNEGQRLIECGYVALKVWHWAGKLGIARKVFENIVDYAKKRVQGGKPIIEHPNIAALLGEADVLLEQTGLFIDKVAWDLDQYGFESLDKLMNMPLRGAFQTNYAIKRCEMRLAEIGFEVYAGIGATKELGFEGWVRGALAFMHGGGTGTFHLIKSAQEL